jgi:hypothetical protein
VPGVSGEFEFDLEIVFGEFDLVLIRMPGEFGLVVIGMPLLDEFDECVLVLDEFDDSVPGDLGIDLELILVSDEYTNGTLNVAGLGILLLVLVRLVRLVSELFDEFALALGLLPDEFDLALGRLPDEFDLALGRLPVLDEFDEFDDSVLGDLGIELDLLLVSELSDECSHGSLAIGRPVLCRLLLVRVVRLISELSDEFELVLVLRLLAPPLRLNTIIYYIYIIIYKTH